MSTESADHYPRKSHKWIWAIVSVLVMWIIIPAHSAVRIPPPEKCREILSQVLDQDDFGQKKIVYRWEPIQKEKKKTWLDQFFKALIDFFRGIRQFLNKWNTPLARFFEIVLWTVFGGAAVWFMYRHTHIRHLFTRSGNKSVPSAQPAPVLFGMTMVPESLPDDIAGACRKLMDNGDIRASLALMYRASLSRLLHTCQLQIPACATELECNRLVKCHRPVSEWTFFSRLTQVWLNTAYGHHIPVRSVIESLIGQWTRLYGNPHDNPPAI